MPDVDPGIALGESRHHDVVLVGKGPVAHPYAVLRARRDLPDAGIGLDIFELGDGGGDVLAELSDPSPVMDEADMGGVERVLDELEPVAGSDLLAREQQAVRAVENV